MRTLVTLLLLAVFSLPVCSAARRNYSQPRRHARSHASGQPAKAKRAAVKRKVRAKRARKGAAARRLSTRHRS